jgi:hypothetical protein
MGFLVADYASRDDLAAVQQAVVGELNLTMPVDLEIVQPVRELLVDGWDLLANERDVDRADGGEGDGE